MLRFGLKLGVAAGVCHYISEQGVWKDTDESIKAYNKIKETIAPYATQVGKQIPFEIPSLPAENKLSYIIKEYWNKGVMSTFQFLIEIPDYTKTYLRIGYHAALEHPEIKKFMESLSKPHEKIEDKK